MFIIGHGVDLPDGNVSVPVVNRQFAKTIASALTLRKVERDLVFIAGTGEILQDDVWLFDWERADATSYARLKLSRSAKMV